MKRGKKKWHETCKYKWRLVKINADVNVKNWSIKEFVIKDLFGILVIMNVNVINPVMLVSARLWKL